MNVMVAQLAEWLVPILKVCSSNPVISKIYPLLVLLSVIEKKKLKQEEAGNDPFLINQLTNKWLCSSVGRAVASETRGPRFESGHRQNLLNICLLSTVLKRRKNKRKKRPGMAHFF